MTSGGEICLKMSSTVTLKLHVALFPAASTAVYVTWLTPTGNVESGGTSEKIVAPTLSKAAGGIHETTAEYEAKSALTTMSVGQ